MTLIIHYKYAKKPDQEHRAKYRDVKVVSSCEALSIVIDNVTCAHVVQNNH